MTIAWILAPEGKLTVVSRPVLSASEFEQLMHADTLINQSKVHAENILARALEQEEAIKTQWRETALREGKAILTKTIAELEQSFQRFKSDTESSLADFLTLCLVQLLDEVGEHSALASRVVKVVRGLLNELPLDLYVAPEALQVVRAALLESGLDKTHQLRIFEDGSLSNTDFSVVTANHCIDGRLSEWLKGMHSIASQATNPSRKQTRSV